MSTNANFIQWLSLFGQNSHVTLISLRSMKFWLKVGCDQGTLFTRSCSMRTRQCSEILYTNKISEELASRGRER